MTVTLIVLFGAGLFCLIVVLLTPGGVCGNTKGLANPAGSEYQSPLATTEVVSQAIAEKAGFAERKVSPLPYCMPEVRLPRLPEPYLQRRLKVESLLPFPVSMVSAVASRELGTFR
jgi:hypothetical protein